VSYLGAVLVNDAAENHRVYIDLIVTYCCTRKPALCSTCGKFVKRIPRQAILNIT